jgi:hypothetical protein
MKGMIIALALLVASSELAQAYVGPGLGLGALGAVVGLFFSVVLAVFALVWYPIKRALGLDRRRAATSKQQPSNG